MAESKRGRSYGWLRQLPDKRDKVFMPTQISAGNPPSVDLLAGMGPVLDQGQLGSCGPNAVDGLIMFDQAKQGLPVCSASRLFMYWNARGGTPTDDGVDNRTMLQSLNKWGFPPEPDWPYDVSQFAVMPPDIAYADAAPNQIESYAAVPQDIDMMKAALAAGFPFLFGFTVYESFESDAVAATGDVPMPDLAREGVLGGHDVVIFGYDDSRQVFLFRNSWGQWGDQGNGTFPYAYCTDPDLSADFWAINAVPGGVLPPPPPPPPPPYASNTVYLDLPRGLYQLTPVPPDGIAGKAKKP